MQNTIDWKKVSQFSGPEQSPGFLLWQISSQWRRRIENALSTIGLTHPQFVLLASVGWLSRNGNTASQVELARYCKMDINMTSQLLRTLEKRGYVERSQRKGDDRSKFPRVTLSGSELIEKALPLVETVDREFFEKLQEDIGTCVALWQRLV